jgi:hypothetical protein
MQSSFSECVIGNPARRAALLPVRTGAAFAFVPVCLVLNKKDQQHPVQCQKVFCPILYSRIYLRPALLTVRCQWHARHWCSSGKWRDPSEIELLLSLCTPHQSRQIS